ncbi:MAG: hypothetical protein IKM73_07850 [Acidaminococcaceae bacterium]|nr:hypothetical protein [Acidaminococcaceae bacterium]
MEERTNIVARITDEATVTLSTDEYRDLMDKATRFDIIFSDVKSSIDGFCENYNRVNDTLVLHALGLANYKPQKPEEA